MEDIISNIHITYVACFKDAHVFKVDFKYTIVKKTIASMLIVTKQKDISIINLQRFLKDESLSVYCKPLFNNDIYKNAKHRFYNIVNYQKSKKLNKLIHTANIEKCILNAAHSSL